MGSFVVQLEGLERKKKLLPVFAEFIPLDERCRNDTTQQGMTESCVCGPYTDHSRPYVQEGLACLEHQLDLIEAEPEAAAPAIGAAPVWRA